MKISIKFAIPVVVSVIVATSVVLVSVNIKLSEIQESVYQSEKKLLETRYKNKLKSLKELVLASSLAVAKSSEVQTGLLDNNRNITINGLKSVVNHFHQYTPYSDIKLHVHDKNQKSFVRHWKLDKYGDDLTGFRQTINEVKRSGKPISAIEIGRAGLLLRGISPVISKEVFIGSAEFILTLDELSSSKLEGTENSEIMFSLLDKKYLDIATSLADSPSFNSKYVLATNNPNADRLFQELKGKMLSTSGTTANYFYTTAPVIDFSGKAVGITVLGTRLNSVNGIIDQSQSVVKNQLIFIAVVFFILVILVFLILNKVVIKPIKTMSKEIDLSRTNRDLSIRLSHNGKDEIGLISSSYNQLIMILNLYLGKNHQSIIDISEAANLMSEATTFTSNGIKNQEVESQEVTENLHVMLNQVQEIADFSQQAAKSATEASSNSLEGKKVSENVSSQIKELANDITHAVTVVEQLKEESQAIESFTSVIKTIAEQTNLLALNAAIEAARAGESGRGFAVVADEVRNLASKTQESTNEIDVIIERLKNTVSSAVEVMNSSNLQADKSLMDVNHMETALETIINSVSNITKVNADIAETTSKQVPMFENLSHNMISSVAQFNQMLNRSLQDTSKAAYKMGVSIKGMYDNIDDFKIDENPALLLLAAKSSHFAWKTRVQSFILGLADVEPSDACSHHDCYFGHWLYSQGKKTFSQYKEYSELVSEHEKVHNSLFNLIDCDKIKDNNGFETASFALGRASNRLFELTDILGSYIGIVSENKNKEINDVSNDENVDLF